MGLYYLITPKIRDNPLEVIASDNTVIEELLNKLQISDITIVELGQLLIKRDDHISQQECVINRMKVALNENMFSQETIRAFENTEANLNLVSIKPRNAPGFVELDVFQDAIRRVLWSADQGYV